MMKLRKDYKLREIAGETILMKQGKNNVDLTRIVSLNGSARVLYESLQDQEFEQKDVEELLMTTFGIDSERARKDAAIWIEGMKECQVIE